MRSHSDDRHCTELGTKVLMPRVDYASLQPCCSLWLFVQLELYSALSLDYAVVVAMSCFCMCLCNTMIIISGSCSAV